VSGHGKPLSLGEGLTKSVVVALLFVVMLFIQTVHHPGHGVLNPVAMATFGFIILAAYTLGEVLEAVKLPHITAYLVTGILCGSHMAEVAGPWGWPEWMAILDHHTVEDLSLFNDLAVALIALSAGGALQLETLKKGARLLGSVLTAQFLALLGILGGLTWLLSGPIEGFTLPFLVGQPASIKIATCVLMALVGSAMSPAASIAIIHETGAKGPVTDTVLGVSVLNNVVVVVLFAIGFSVTAGMVVPGTESGGLARELAIKIGGAVLLGGALGAGVAAYIRWVSQELLLVLAGLSFALTWLGRSLGVDPLLAFLFAGFIVRNFTRPACHAALNEAVNRLSLPIYVVFFFIAGAHLDLHSLTEAWIFALVLFAARALALYGGTAVGGLLGRGPKSLRTVGWMGFGAQAGIALAMAKSVEALGGPGVDIATMAVAGVALNEMFGPVMLKVSLGLAGETDHTPVATEAEEFTRAEDATAEFVPLMPEWSPEPGHSHFDPWGPAPAVSYRRLLEVSRDLKLGLQDLTRELRGGLASARRGEAQQFLGRLRREMLRYHRRLMVKAADPGTTVEDMHTAVRETRTQLARSWENEILDRAASVDFRAERHTMESMVRALDRLVDQLPQATEVPYEAALLAPRDGDTNLVAVQKLAARATHGLGLGHDMRVVELRPIARYALSGQVPLHLPELAGLLALSERHLMARTRNLFEALRRTEDALLAHEDFVPGKWDALLQLVREEMEEEFQLASREVDRLADETVRVASGVLGRGYKSFNAMLAVAGTPELPTSAYAFSKVYGHREAALQQLQQGLANSRELTRGVASGMAMELQLLRMRDLARERVTEHADQLTRELQGRVVVQTGRILEGLDGAISGLERALVAEYSPRRMTEELRGVLQPLVHLVDDAVGVTEGMRDGLRTESSVEPLRVALSSGVDSLTDHFTVALNPPGLTGRRLPTAPTLEDVPFRELAASYLDAEIGRDLSLISEELLEAVDETVRAAEELQRSLQFNLELSTTELAVLPDQDGAMSPEACEVLRETLLGTVQRLATRMTQLHRARDGLGVEAGERIRESVFKHIDALHDLLVVGRWDEVRRRLQRGQIERRKQLLTGGAESIVDFSVHLREALQKAMGASNYERARRALGLPEEVPDELGPADFARPRSDVELPVVFKRLFSDAALEAADLLSGQDEQVAELRQVLLGRGQGHSRAVAVLGQGGPARMAAVNALLRGLDVKVVRETFTEPATVDQILQIEARASGNAIVIVDGAHWLFSIEPRGFEALRAFTSMVVEDDGNNSWVLSIERSVWDYADRVVALHDVFPHHLLLHPLDAQGLRQAILNRHGMSGYKLRYARPEGNLGWWLKEALNHRAASQDESGDALYEQHYFEHLDEATGGVLADALRLWTASVADVDLDTDTIVIGEVPPTPLGAIRQLDQAHLVTLRQIARQGRVDVKLHARQFRLDEDRSRGELSRLAHLGLIRRTRRGRYALVEHLVPAIQRVLAERGLTG
jgi:Kef-type K+ transport system membrane component KefB